MTRQNGSGATALHEACASNDFVALDVLLTATPPLDIHALDAHGNTALHLAAAAFACEVILFTCSELYSRMCALNVFSLSPRPQCAGLLLCAEPVIASVSVTNAQGETPLQLAQQALDVHHKPYMQRLLERAADLNAFHRHSLILKLPLLKASLHAAGVQTFHASGPYQRHEDVPADWTRQHRMPVQAATTAAETP